DTKVEETVKVEQQTVVEQQKTEVPKVTKELKDQTIVKGVKITEETKYEWKLTIESTTFETGTISVKGVNESGTAETKCEMKVIEKPELSETLKDINATLGEPIKVEVTAKVAAQFKWMINGQTLEDGKDGVHVTTENGKSTLTIDKAEPSHSGKLTVVTSNEAGTVESTSQITVTPKSAAPQIIEGPKDVNIKEKETAEFKVKSLYISRFLLAPLYPNGLQLASVIFFERFA
ncbi:unnamed protein product, partial [Nippostrongylus brasiliensis]|uniref:Ig-like domain-containing protein n=1 Tax=Nippostrongylus brasiliensis TaxID=27835 RepID=A0A0N4XLS0_NIPBR